MLTVIDEIAPRVEATGFVDGNKRLAFAAADVFLRLNGCRLTLSDEEAYQLTMRVARGEMDKDPIASLLRSNLERT